MDMDKEKRILYPDMLRTSAAFAVVMIHIAELGIAGSSGLFDSQASCIFRRHVYGASHAFL